VTAMTSTISTLATAAGSRACCRTSRNRRAAASSSWSWRRGAGLVRRQ